MDGHLDPGGNSEATKRDTQHDLKAGQKGTWTGMWGIQGSGCAREDSGRS